MQTAKPRRTVGKFNHHISLILSIQCELTTRDTASHKRICAIDTQCHLFCESRISRMFSVNSSGTPRYCTFFFRILRWSGIPDHRHGLSFFHRNLTKPNWVVSAALSVYLYRFAAVLHRLSFWYSCASSILRVGLLYLFPIAGKRESISFFIQGGTAFQSSLDPLHWACISFQRSVFLFSQHTHNQIG